MPRRSDGPRSPPLSRRVARLPSRTSRCGRIRTVPEPSLKDYLAKAPTGAESVRESVDAMRHLTPDERLKALDRWMTEILAILGDREPAAEPGLPFWRHWKDPSLGRPA